ncbi:hypothetical protein FACS1894168_1040 [Deltaproteobacteria bacterium]|nr:hypothetical protein FACS1894168_1040 [Deltaproteobacteria bacterium]
MNSVFTDVKRCLVEGPRVTEDSCFAAFIFPESFTGFSGHFLDNPIVPGIAQIFAAQITTGLDSELAEVKRCKFIRPVVPGTRVEVTLWKKIENNIARCKAEITANGEGCASMSFTLICRMGCR